MYLRILVLLGAALLGAGMSAQTLSQIRDTGPRANRVNLVFVSEGYTAAEQALFEQHVARRLPGLLADDSWRRFADHVNIFRLFVPSRESGVDVIDRGIERDTAFDFGVVSTGGLRFPMEKLDAAVLPHIPDYDVAILFVNSSVLNNGTGWGGKLAMMMNPTLDSPAGDNLLLHELGHAFAGLADEYFDSTPVSTPPAPTRFPNVSSETARDRVPWARFISPATPVPTTSAGDENLVGVYAGANGRADLTRPTFDSKMRTTSRPWGPVNLRAFADAIHRLNLNGATTPPTITRQPAGATVARGGSTTLNVQATGVGPLTYQWKRNGVYLPAIEPSLTVPAVDEASAGIYSVEVMNAAGATLSNDVTVTLAGDTRAEQTIALSPIADHNMGDAPFTISATASSGLPVALRVAAGPATLAGNTVTLTAGGVVSIEAAQPGDARYLPAVAMRTFNVMPAAATLDLYSLNQYANGNPKSVGALTTPHGLAVRFTYAAIPGGVASETPPSAPGQYAVVATVSDPRYAGTATGVLTLYGRSSAAAPTLQPTTTLLTATAGVSFSYQVVATGTVTRYAASGLPPGLAIDAVSGRISGTPTAPFPLQPVYITVTNAAGFDLQPLDLQVVPMPAAPVVRNSSPMIATVGAPFAARIVGAVYATTDAFSAENLPAGLTVDRGSGVITGTPTQAGTTTANLRITNYVGTTGSASVRIEVQPATPGAPEIGGSAVLETSPFGAWNCQLVASNTPTRFSATGLPPWLSLDPDTGMLSGTVSGEFEPIAIALSASNGTGSCSTQMLLYPGSTAINTPGVRSVTWPAARDYRPGEELLVVVEFSLSSVVVTGTPRLPLLVGSRLRYANYASGSGTVRLTFRYSLAPDDQDEDGVVFGTFIDLNGGTLIGHAGTPTPAARNLRPVDTSGVRVLSAADTTPPTIVSFTASTETPSFRLVFSETVTGVDPADFSVAATGATASVGTVSGSGTTFIVPITVSATGSDPATVRLTLNGGAAAGIADAAGNLFAGGAGSTSTVYNVPGGPPSSVPVVSPATLTGQVGVAITPLTLTASNGPLAWSAPGLAAYGLGVNSSGIVSGTPTQPAAGVAVPITASNRDGPGMNTLVLNITAAPPPPPPAGGGSGGGPPAPPPAGGGGGTVSPPVATTRADQTISFVSPVSSIFVGQPTPLGGTTSSGLPLAFTLVSGNATLDGDVITIRDTTPVVVRASQPGNGQFNAADAVTVTLSASKNAQIITVTPLSDVPATAAAFAIQATSSSGLPVTLSVSGPAALLGTTLTLTGLPGTVTVTASQAGNDAYAAAAATRSFVVRAAGAQVFFGRIGSDEFAVAVNGAQGLFLTRAADTGHVMIARFSVSESGSFRAPVTVLPAAPQMRTVQGTIADGVLTGTIVEIGLAFTARAEPALGAASALAGAYSGRVPGSASGEGYLIVAPTARAFALAALPAGTQSSTGTVSSDGRFNLATADGGAITGRIDAGRLEGAVTAHGAESRLVGISEGTTRTDRIINLSSRLRVTSGDASRAVIAGFVVNGAAAKRVLIRAVGPGLATFGVGGALPNPGLRVFRNGTLVAENNDWGSQAEAAAVARQVGAFALGAGSADAALVAELAPGAYTAVIEANGGSGVALVEVYDTATGAPLDEQLVNISTRGFVDTGDGQLIAGFVVSGNGPKRVLIRGIGPGLGQFGVPAVVADPTLRLYAGDGTTLVAENDDWGTPRALSANQDAATAADVVAASAVAGAFPLGAASKDAAIVITLLPGQYSAVVSGVANGTGAGLVEVYQLP